jgi:hypothetical protein
VYWATENTHDIMTREVNLPGVTCWVGIWSGGTVGPHFFEGPVTGDRYRTLLEEAVLPEVQHAPHFQNRQMIFQQNGAPPHWTLSVRPLLDDTFPEWIGQGGTIPWPARSCDITPCHFSMWGIAKDDVFSNHPRTIPELKVCIEDAFTRLNDDPALCDQICSSVPNRCNAVVEHGGLHIEQFLLGIFCK